jgi:hypothetical protein
MSPPQPLKRTIPLRQQRHCGSLIPAPISPPLILAPPGNQFPRSRSTHTWSFNHFSERTIEDATVQRLTGRRLPPLKALLNPLTTPPTALRFSLACVPLSTRDLCSCPAFGHLTKPGHPVASEMCHNGWLQELILRPQWVSCRESSGGKWLPARKRGYKLQRRKVGGY